MINSTELSPLLQQEVTRNLQDFLSHEGVEELLQQHPQAAENLARVWACSPFIARHCCRRPSMLTDLLNSGDLQGSSDEPRILQQLRTAIADCNDEAGLMRVLREIRNREMLRIGWRDIAGWCELPETLRDLSLLADACLQTTLDWLVEKMRPLYGTPQNSEGEAQSMIVIAMGKLGARELNYSSDIDLIFCFTERGETRGGKRSVSNDEYFNKLAKQIIRCINDITEDGFVFRVDMRLRPFGDSGPLVTSLGAMEGYYEAHARDWERYAMIKARVCAGDLEVGAQLMQFLRPFVYRRYIDFGALESLRDMKQLINDEVKRKGIHENVKLGAGGIREIEFIGQVFQLIRGGKEPKLRRHSILKILPVLENLQLLPVSTVDDLTQAYWFLRNTEHRLQQINDQQTQSLPKSEIDRARVTLGMGFTSWEDFIQELSAHRSRVSTHFADLLRAPDQDDTQDESQIQTLTSLWHGNLEGEAAEKFLLKHGYKKPAKALEKIIQLREMRTTRQLSQQGRERLDRLMPLVLDAASSSSAPGVSLTRLLNLIETIARRSTYLTLLTENPQALAHLVRLMTESSWVADQIITHPLLLDELIDPRVLYSPPGAAELQKDLHIRLYKCTRGDQEQYMDCLRHFKNAQVLRVAAADITDNLALKDVSNHLAAIAETALDTALTLAWTQLRVKHGEPCYHDDDGEQLAGFCIVAYGKLGGLELGYSSDLDLVFLHDSQGRQQMTNGERPLDNTVFFNRLGQRIINLMSAITPAGMLYEVDSRLRPNGASGILVSSIDSFREYQLDKAWTWEHQALVRARVVTGNPRTASLFQAIRHETLLIPPDTEKLRLDIIEMREKMRQELKLSEEGIFDLKQGLGGITDIEFMVQYAVLRWAHVYPELLTWTDNLRLLDDLARLDLMTKADSEHLREAYFAYRAVTHRRALQNGKALVRDDKFLDHRQQVIRIWNEFMGEVR